MRVSDWKQAVSGKAECDRMRRRTFFPMTPRQAIEGVAIVNCAQTYHGISKDVG